MAFAMLFPNQELFIFPLPMPIKAKWLIIGYFVLEIGLGLMANDGIAHFAHLGGMIFGFLLSIYWKSRVRTYCIYTTAYFKIRRIIY